MSVCRVRLQRDFPATGRFNWALLDDHGTVLDSASSELAMPPRGWRCEAVLAAELVLLDRVSVPAAQQRRVQGALHFLAEDRLVPDPYRVHLAAERAPQKDLCYMAIIDRDWFSQALARLARLGLVPAAAYSECLLPRLEPRAWVVVCDGDESFARTGEHEGFALDSLGEGEPPVGLKLAANNAREAGVPPERIVVRAAPGAMLPDATRWSQTLALPVEAGVPWSWMQIEDKPDLDLLQGEFAPRAAGSLWRGRLWRPVLLASATLAVASCGLAADWALKSAERNRLQQEMRTLYRDAFGASALIVDPPLQMARAHADLALLAGDGGGGELITLLNALTPHLPDRATHTVETLTYEAGRLTLSLRGRDARQSAIAAHLRAKTVRPGVDVRVEEAEGGVLRVTALTRGLR